jgi:hypothetical protein
LKYNPDTSILYTNENQQDSRSSCKKKPTSDAPLTSHPVPLPQTSIKENTSAGSLESEGDDPTKVCPNGIKSFKRKESKVQLSQNKFRVLERNSAKSSK